MTIRIVENAGSLSEEDLKLLSGTPLIEKMMRTRIMLMIEKNQEFDWTDLTKDMMGLYHIREITRNRLYQMWFEYPQDLDQFKKNLYVVKLSLDSATV